jgi:hypothetical protein
MPSIPIAVSSTEPATTHLVPSFLIIGPATKLTPAVHIAIIVDITGAKLISSPKSICINGQATPNKESGSPREINAR